MECWVGSDHIDPRYKLIEEMENIEWKIHMIRYEKNIDKEVGVYVLVISQDRVVGIVLQLIELLTWH